jgi:hypothetical protein
MNRIGVRGGASTEVQKRQVDQLVAFAGNRARLRDWGRQEYRRLAADFDPLADIPWRIGRSSGRPADARPRK